MTLHSLKAHSLPTRCYLIEILLLHLPILRFHLVCYVHQNHSFLHWGNKELLGFTHSNSHENLGHQ